MANTVQFEEIQSSDNVVYDLQGFILWQSFALAEYPTEITLSAELQNQVYIVLCEKTVVDADDEGTWHNVHLVRKVLEYCYFVLDDFLDVWPILLDQGEAHCFDGYDIIGLDDDTFIN